MKMVTVFMILVSGCWLFGQEPVKTDIYLSDFDFFIEKLVETHPDPYSAFGNQIEFYRVKQQFRDEIKDVSDNTEFAIKMNLFIAKLEDGHTFINIPIDKSNAEIKSLPLKLKASANCLFVQNSTKEFKDLIGKPIIRINNKTVEELLEEITNWSPTENISGAYYNLIRALNNNSTATPLFGITDALEITFGEPLKNKTIKVPFLQSVNFLPSESKIESSKSKGLLYYSMLGAKKDIGYFRWNSVVSREVLQKAYQDNPENIKKHWAYRALKIEENTGAANDILQAPSLYEQFYLLFSEMKKQKSEYLIIDLRNNGGGMTSLVKPLLYILYGSDYLNFDFDAEMIRKLSPLYLQKIGKKSIEEFNKAYYCDFRSGDYTFSPFGGIGYNLTLAEKRKIVENGYHGFGANYVIKTNPNTRFRPKIVVLGSPGTFSAAYHFIYFLKKLGNTTLIGVAPRQAGNTFMETTSFQLPKTRLHASISNSKQILFKENQELGKLLKPDYEMNRKDYKEYNFDKNAELLKAIDLIEKGKIVALRK